MKANGNAQMIQQRDHLTLQNTEHTPESAHLNVPFVHKTKGLPVFYAPRPHCGLSVLNVALKLDFLMLPAFPCLMPEPVWAQTPSTAAPAELLLGPISSHGSAWFPTALICSDLGTSAPTVPSPPLHQPLPSEPSVERNLHNYRDCALHP